MTTRVGDVIDALVALAEATVDTSTVAVFDGPQPVFDPPEQFVAIGWDTGDEAGSGISADITQEWASLGNRAKDETGTVNCAVGVWTGDTNAKGRRDTAAAIIGQLETALRADATLGIALVRNVGLSTGSLTQEQIDDGVRAIVAFTVNYTARI